MSIATSEIELDSSPASSSPGYADMLQLAWRRKAWVGLGAAVGLILGSLYYAQRTPIYQSSAQVLVIKKRPDVVSVGGMDASVDDYVSTHVALIRSPLIIERAVEKWELYTLNSFAGQPDPATSIITNLNVIRDNTTSTTSNILLLTYKGPVPDECSMVLNAIIDCYEEFLSETYENANDDTLRLIAEKAEEVQDDLERKGQEYQEFRKNAPLAWNGKDSNLHQERLAAIEEKRSELQIRRTEIEPKLAALNSALAEGKPHAELAAMVKRWEKKNETSAEIDRKVASALDAPKSAEAALEEKLFPLILQERSLLEDHGRDHPEVVSIRRQIEMTRDFYTKLEAKTKRTEPAPEDDAAEVPLDPVDEYRAQLQQELRDIADSERSLGELFEGERASARELLNFEAEDSRFTSEIARGEQFHESLLKQLQGINIGKDIGGYTTRIIAPATEGKRIEPRMTPIFGMATLLGLMGGFGLAYLAEISDKRFRSPEEIRRRLNLPLIGHIPFLEDSQRALALQQGGSATLDPKLVLYYHPKSVDAEAFRGIRTAIYFSTDGQSHKVIQFTSPNAGDGKTTVTANLAISIAQSGKQVLVIDADLRKPRVHQVFGISSKVGLASVIAGEAEIEDAIQRHPSIANLSILPCGTLPSNPAELLTSTRFEELLEMLGERYDFVLVDTPPVLAVTDPCVVAARVDGVVLTISLTKQVRPQAERARDVLANLGVTLLGVVVNGVDRETGYGYGYGEDYGYGYGYGQGYTSNDDDRPIQSDDSDVQPVEETALVPAAAANGHGESRHGKQSMWSRLSLW